MQGFLNIDKPSAWTSRDVVNVVQKLFPRGTKLGHAGTLDPLATGVLVIAVGRATRLISYAQEGVKTYLGEFLLGRMSDTEDIEGNVVELASPPIPALDQLKDAAKTFIGPIMQRPPAYSAIQVKGQRAYDLARRGERVDLAPRPVRIESVKILSYDYPKFEMQVVCGKGTYIRSLGRDLGEKLGSAAVMSRLRRTRVGAFSLETALELELEPLRAAGAAPPLLPSLLAVPDEIPRVELAPALLQRLLMGQAIPLPEELPRIALLSCDGELASVARRQSDGAYRAEINLLSPEEVL